MFIVFLVLAVLFGVSLIAGFILAMLQRGQSSTKRGPQVGAEQMQRRQRPRRPGVNIDIPITGESSFQGEGVEKEWDAVYSLAEIRQHLGAGRLRPVLPALMMIVGLIGLTLFLGVALVVGVSGRVFGYFLIAFSLYSAYLLLSGMRK
jgi:hypothetical protein